LQMRLKWQRKRFKIKQSSSELGISCKEREINCAFLDFSYWTESTALKSLHIACVFMGHFL
jgi:hypothetical protein